MTARAFRLWTLARTDLLALGRDRQTLLWPILFALTVTASLGAAGEWRGARLAFLAGGSALLGVAPILAAAAAMGLAAREDMALGGREEVIRLVSLRDLLLARAAALSLWIALAGLAQAVLLIAFSGAAEPQDPLPWLAALASVPGMGLCAALASHASRDRGEGAGWGAGQVLLVVGLFPLTVPVVHLGVAGWEGGMDTGELVRWLGFLAALDALYLLVLLFVSGDGRGRGSGEA